jgi:hypothetical protein
MKRISARAHCRPGDDALPQDVYQVYGDGDLSKIVCENVSGWDPLIDAAYDGVRFPLNRRVPVTYATLFPAERAVLTMCLNFMGGALLLAEEAIATLAPLLSGAGYFIDTELPAERQYRLFVCERELDALDEDRSELERFPDGGIWHVLRYEFHEDRLDGADIFKIRGLRARLFVTDRFVSMVNEHGMFGFEFIHVWNKTMRGDRFNPHELKYEAYPGETEQRAEAKRRAARAAMARLRAKPSPSA